MSWLTSVFSRGVSRTFGMGISDMRSPNGRVFALIIPASAGESHPLDTVPEYDFGYDIPGFEVITRRKMSVPIDFEKKFPCSDLRMS